MHVYDAMQMSFVSYYSLFLAIDEAVCCFVSVASSFVISIASFVSILVGYFRVVLFVTLIIINRIYALYPKKKLCSRRFTKYRM